MSLLQNWFGSFLQLEFATVLLNRKDAVFLFFLSFHKTLFGSQWLKHRHNTNPAQCYHASITRYEFQQVPHIQKSRAECLKGQNCHSSAVFSSARGSYARYELKLPLSCINIAQLLAMEKLLMQPGNPYFCHLPQLKCNQRDNREACHPLIHCDFVEEEFNTHTLYMPQRSWCPSPYVNSHGCTILITNGINSMGSNAGNKCDVRS